MRLYKCWFCSSTVYPGHGNVFCRNDGKAFKFCRGKCFKAFKKKRNPRKVRWTKAYRKHNSKEASSDSVFQFERRRARPEKYDRETMIKTITAMKRIEEITIKRQKRYHKKRMDDSKEFVNQHKRRELERHIGTVISKNALKNKASLKKVAVQLIEKRRKRENRPAFLYENRLKANRKKAAEKEVRPQVLPMMGNNDKEDEMML